MKQGSHINTAVFNFGVSSRTRSNKKHTTVNLEDKHIYDVIPDTLAPPLPLPRLVQRSVASFPEHLTNMTINAAYDATATPDKPQVVHRTSSPEQLNMTINTAYDATATPDKP